MRSNGDWNEELRYFEFKQIGAFENLDIRKPLKGIAPTHNVQNLLEAQQNQSLKAALEERSNEIKTKLTKQKSNVGSRGSLPENTVDIAHASVPKRKHQRNFGFAVRASRIEDATKDGAVSADLLNQLQHAHDPEQKALRKKQSFHPEGFARKRNSEARASSPTKFELQRVIQRRKSNYKNDLVWIPEVDGVVHASELASESSSEPAASSDSADEAFVAPADFRLEMLNFVQSRAEKSSFVLKKVR